MAAMSDFLENKLIDWFFRAQAINITGATAAAGTGPANLYIGLLTTTPTDSTAGTEVTGNAYARVAVASSTTAWDNTQQASTTAASSGVTGTTRNQAIITFPTPTPAGWGTVTGVGIYDAAAAGNLLIYSALTVSKTINVGDSVTFPANSLTFQIDN
jgi:hypothetical protein